MGDLESETVSLVVCWAMLCAGRLGVWQEPHQNPRGPELQCLGRGVAPGCVDMGLEISL